MRLGAQLHAARAAGQLHARRHVHRVPEHAEAGAQHADDAGHDGAGGDADADADGALRRRDLGGGRGRVEVEREPQRRARVVQPGRKQAGHREVRVAGENKMGRGVV